MVNMLRSNLSFRTFAAGAKPEVKQTHNSQDQCTFTRQPHQWLLLLLKPEGADKAVAIQNEFPPRQRGNSLNQFGAHLCAAVFGVTCPH